MIAGFMILMGAGAFAACARMATRTLEVRGWPTTPAVLVHKQAVPSRIPGGSPGVRWELNVEYVYTVDGHEFSGREYKPQAAVMRRSDVDALIASLPERMEARYNPLDPSEAYLSTHSLVWPLIGAITGLFTFLLGLGRILGGAMTQQ